jgi:hypothetical protein
LRFGEELSDPLEADATRLERLGTGEIQSMRTGPSTWVGKTTLHTQMSKPKSLPDSILGAQERAAFYTKLEGAAGMQARRGGGADPHQTLLLQ